MAIDDQGRIEIEVAVRDSLTVALKQMGRSLLEMKEKANEGTKGVVSMDNAMAFLSKTLHGPVGVVAGITALGTAAGRVMLDFAQSRTQLQLFAETSRISSREVTALRNTMELAGVPIKEAGGYVGSLTGALKDMWMNKWGSRAAEQAKLYGDVTVASMNRVMDAVAGGDISKGISKVLEELRNTAPEHRAKMLEFYSSVFGVPVPIFEKFLTDYQAMLDRVPGMNDAAARRVNEIWTEWRQKFNQGWDQTLNELATKFVDKMERINAGVEKSIEAGKRAKEFPSERGQTWGWEGDPYGAGYSGPEGQRREREELKEAWPFRWFKRSALEGDTTELSARSMSGGYGGMKAFEKGGLIAVAKSLGYQIPPWLEKIHGVANNPDLIMAASSLNPLSMPGAIPNRALMAEMPVSASTGLLDWRRRLGLGGDDSHAILVDIRDILQRIEEKPSAGREAGQQAASLYGTGIRGGQMQAGLGGFRSGYGGQTRADRNNNPGNIKYGDFAKAQGATGADESGFAIFPDKEIGFRASEALLGSKNYSGLTLSQIGQQWAEGDPGWAANVSKATGIPLEAVPTPEQRTQMARIGIPRAEGFGGGGGGGAIPSEILSKAREAALTGGPGAVYKFIRSQGYSVNSAWCGDFAAAVVKAAGGTPPRNPQIASNWRNFGQETRAPQPGDIAVRRGVPTGATGSHVTVVEGYDPETGAFTGIGGNQGGPRSRFPIGGYQFYRDEAAFGEKIDRSLSRMSSRGTISAEVSFKNVWPGVSTRADTAGEIFEKLKVNNLKQAPRADASTADPYPWAMSN